MELLVSDYTEAGFKGIPPLNLPDKEYARGLRCFVPACTDTVPIDPCRRLIYLTRRRIKPMMGWWWIGGRMAPFESKEEAVVRSFKRETQLELADERFILAAIFDYRWKDRAQEPQDIGCHTLSYTFTTELSPEELAMVSGNLDQSEYEGGVSLTAFDRDSLLAIDAAPPILELYDHIFPNPKKQLTSSLLELVSSDERRDIHEIEFASSAFRDYVIKGDTGPLGQHYHRQTEEIFYFLEGGGLIRTAKVNIDGNIVSPVETHEVKRGSIIQINPWHAHRLDLAPGTRFVAFASQPFDPNDMFACPIK